MITLYIGKSAVGKDTFMKKQVSLGVTPIVSYTTRPPRDDEVDGVDYHFVSELEFKQMIAHNSLAEWRSYETRVDDIPATWYYGSPWLDKEKDYVGVVTPEGVLSYIKIYGPEVLQVVYIKVDEPIRRARAEARASFNETEWNRRLVTDDRDFHPDRINSLVWRLHKPITVMYNNGDEDRVTFDQLNPYYDYSDMSCIVPGDPEMSKYVRENKLDIGTLLSYWAAESLKEKNGEHKDSSSN